MKRILILVIWALSCSIISAQKYTNQYIKDANKVGLRWLNDINHNQYENTKEHTEYLLLKQNDKAKWEIQIFEYMWQNKTPGE